MTKDKGEQRGLVPIRFSRSKQPTQQLKLLAAIDAVVLSQVQKLPIQAAKIIYGPDYDTTKVNLAAPTGPTNLAAQARQVLTELEVLVSNRSGKLMLNRHCDVCEFRNRCHQEAVDKDDLSLLRSLSRREIETFNERGVFTVTQLAHTFRAKSMRHTQQKRHSIPLQAKAIKDNTVYIRKTPQLPPEDSRIYFDVEGTPDTDRYYLIGMLIENGADVTARTYWADSPDEEEAMWRAFLAEVLILGNCPLFHFGRYERDFVNCMFQRYRSNDAAVKEQLDNRLFDIHAAVRTNVFFPVHSNGLKPIATFLGASWSGPVTTGIGSIVWRHHWEQTKEGQLKQELVRYNAEDCSGLKIVSDFLRSLSAPNNKSTVSTKLTETLADSTGFGSKNFAIPEIQQFTKCAYFNYQHDKIFFRTDKNVRRSIRRKKKVTRAKLRVNETVECGPPEKCLKCGAAKITSYWSSKQTKVVRDLKFVKGGVKRWVVKHVTLRYQCLSCRHTCFSPEYPTKQSKVGRNLTKWVVWQHAALRLSCRDAVEALNDLFGYAFNERLVERAKRRLATSYLETTNEIRRRLLAGAFICVDEAKITVKGKPGYVWTFSNAEEVLYRFSETRDGAILKEVLNGYKGVVVSDFFVAYDSAEWVQQKCLIHLIRDINDDLLKAPFNDELKGIAQPFCDLLKAIIDTIDRHGLKKRHLNQFVNKAGKFRERVVRQEFKSKTARCYQKRISKYGDRLFTFLEHDGVPWNNNIAENAVKLIVSRRRFFGASFSKQGMEDYLLFLSILQTLRRKGGSFLRFLISEEMDLFKFVGEK